MEKRHSAISHSHRSQDAFIGFSSVKHLYHRPETSIKRQDLLEAASHVMYIHDLFDESLATNNSGDLARVHPIPIDEVQDFLLVSELVRVECTADLALEACAIVVEYEVERRGTVQVMRDV